MPVYRFYALADSVCKSLNIPPVPFPVRKDHANEIFTSRGAYLDLLLDELERYLIAHPEECVFYKEAGAQLASIEAIRLGEEGFADLAAHYFELGLALDPDNLALRSNYALALQSAGRLDDAMRQYRFLLQQPAISGQFPVLIPSAKLFLDCGDPVTAHQILKHCASFMPADNEFWELYAEARQRCGIKRQTVPGQKQAAGESFVCPASEKGNKAPGKNFCPACGNRLKPDARFCGGCGRAL